MMYGILGGLKVVLWMIDEMSKAMAEMLETIQGNTKNTSLLLQAMAKLVERVQHMDKRIAELERIHNGD